MADNKKVVGFKKFSELKKKSGVEEVDLSLVPKTGADIPMNPNLSSDSTNIEKPISRKGLQPEKQDIDLPENDDVITLDGDKTHEQRVETFGRVAKFPKNIKASKAYNFMENVKISKKSIWYLMIEKQDNELQMVKYNYKEGVDLVKFINELKSYYIDKYKDNEKICESINKISITGNDKYSIIKDIPLVEVDGKKIITKISEDLIKLLSK